MIAKPKQSAVWTGNIEALRRLIEVATSRLRGDLSIEVALGVLLSSLIRLIECHGDELGFERCNNLPI